MLSQGQALLGWWAPCCDGEGWSGAATALGSVRDQTECAKAELGMGISSSLLGPGLSWAGGLWTWVLLGSSQGRAAATTVQQLWLLGLSWHLKGN